MVTPSRSSHAPPLLVGREREQAALRDHLADAIAGHGGLVLIGGEAGIGKTALAEAVCQEAEARDALVLVGRCYDLTETPPYGPWVEAFDGYRPADGWPPLPEAFARRGTVGEVASQVALFRQVLDFLKALGASQPAVLLLDDLHWADPASLDLLRFLARTAATLPVLLLATYRIDAPTRETPLYALLPTLVREAHAERLDLRPLDADALRALLASRYRLDAADTSRLIGYLREHAEGNPFFLLELLRALEEERTLFSSDDAWTLGDLGAVRLPALLRQVIDGRLARLGPGTRALLAIAAVIGHEVPLAVWGLVGECDEDALLALVEQGLDARLLSEGSGGDRVRFAHALIREALYEGIPATRGRRVHRRVGDVLAAARTPDPDAVAYHFQRAEDDRALPWLLKAGQRAQAAYAWVTAAARFEAALALMERTDTDAGERGWLLLHCSRLLRYVDVAKARVFAEEAVEVGRAMDDRTLTAFAGYQHGLLVCFAGDVASGLPEMETGADAMATLTETERAQYTAHASTISSAASQWPDMRGTVVMWRAYVGPFPEVRVRGEGLIAAAPEGDEAAQQDVRDAHFGLGYAYAVLGRPDAAAMFAAARDAYLRADHPAVAALASWLELELVALPYRTDDVAGRRWLAERAEGEHRRASGVVSATVPPRFMRVPLLVVEGDWAEAQRLAAAVSGEARGLRHYRMMALRHLATVARLRGDVERARWAVQECLPTGSATEPGTAWPFDVITAVQRAAARLSLDEGDMQSADAWLQAHDRWLAWSGAVLGRAEGALAWAAYFRARRAMQIPLTSAREAIAHATDPRQPLALLAAHRTLGALHTDAGRFNDAATHLAASLALADACAAPFERALTLLALAELRAAEGTRAAAAALIDQVRAICTPLGARSTLDRADALAVRLSAEKETRPAYPAGLSAREVEVLRLVAAGLTNAQVAERPFLSPRTVNAHLTTIYTKIGVSTRAAAATFAVQHGLAG